MSHALLSPSAAHRWLNCTKSARLEEKFPEESSDAAMEGTIAHALCAELLREYTLYSEYSVKDCVVNVSKDKDGGYTLDEFNRWLCPDMIKYAEDYATYVWSAYQDELKRQ